VRVKECGDLFGKNNQRLWTGHRDLWALVKAIENRWDEAERRALKMYVGYEHERNNKELHPSASALFAAVSDPTHFSARRTPRNVSPNWARINGA
jgi:hypothetical protein